MYFDELGFNWRQGLAIGGTLALLLIAAAAVGYVAGPLADNARRWYAFGLEFCLAGCVVRLALFRRFGWRLSLQLEKPFGVTAAGRLHAVLNELGLLVVYVVLLWIAPTCRRPDYWPLSAGAAWLAVVKHGITVNRKTDPVTNWPWEWRRYRRALGDAANPDSESERLLRRSRRQSHKQAAAADKTVAARNR